MEEADKMAVVPPGLLKRTLMGTSGVVVVVVVVVVVRI